MASHMNFDPKPYKDGLWAREERRLEAIKERVKEARSFLPRMVEALRHIDPELSRIVLFGSLAGGNPERENFDIDIGVRSSQYYKLVAWTLDQEWKIDLIDLDAASKGILDDIEGKGVILYEKT